MANCKNCEAMTDELKKAKRLIEAIAAHATANAQAAVNEMSRGDVPQGRYAFLKAELETSNDILDLLNVDRIELKKRSKGMFTGLFGGLKL